MRRLLPLVAVAASACGHLGPGTAFSGGRSSSSPDFSTSSSSSRSSADSKPVYDDKGCANMSGEGGAKIQAACRAGK